MSAWADYDEQLGYDADHDDSSQYCQHGNFRGSWWGPDYLCQWCEDGISVEEMHRIQEASWRHACQERLEEFDRVVGAFQSLVPEHGFKGAWAEILLRVADGDHWDMARHALNA